MAYLHGASISHIERRSIQKRLGWCFNISQGNNIIIDAFRVYLHGASMSLRVRRSLKVRLGCIRLVLQYLTGKEGHYRYV